MHKELKTFQTYLKPGEEVIVGDGVEIQFLKEKGSSGKVQIRAPAAIPIEKVERD